MDSATNELPLSAINFRANTATRRLSGGSVLLNSPDVGSGPQQLSALEQIFETILLLPEIVKHSRISLMATNERPLSCSTCLFGPLSTSNSLNNLSGGRRSSLLNTIDEESLSVALTADHLTGIVGGGDCESDKRSLARSTSAPELYSKALISDSVTFELASAVGTPEAAADSIVTQQQPPLTLRALRFRGNKSMSVDATAVPVVSGGGVDESKRAASASVSSLLLLDHIKSSSFLAHILLEPTLCHELATNPPVDYAPLLATDQVIVEEDSSPNPKGLSLSIKSPSSPSPVDDTVGPPCNAASINLCRRNRPNLPNVELLPSNNTSSTTAPSTTTTTTARRPRHSFAGQMSYSKLWGFGGKKMPTTTSTNSLFSTAVISGSSSAPNLRDMIQNANTTGEWDFVSDRVLDLTVTCNCVLRNVIELNLSTSHQLWRASAECHRFDHWRRCTMHCPCASWTRSWSA